MRVTHIIFFEKLQRYTCSGAWRGSPGDARGALGGPRHGASNGPGVVAIGPRDAAFSPEEPPGGPSGPWQGGCGAHGNGPRGAWQRAGQARWGRWGSGAEPPLAGGVRGGSMPPPPDRNKGFTDNYTSSGVWPRCARFGHVRTYIGVSKSAVCGEGISEHGLSQMPLWLSLAQQPPSLSLQQEERRQCSRSRCRHHPCPCAARRAPTQRAAEV